MPSPIIMLLFVIPVEMERDCVYPVLTLTFVRGENRQFHRALPPICLVLSFSVRLFVPNKGYPSLALLVIRAMYRTRLR